MTSGYPSLQITEDDVTLILAAGAHKWSGKGIGFQMKQYMFGGRSSDGCSLLNIRKMWEKLVLAARAIVAIDNPADICVIGFKEDVQRAVLKFAHYTGSVPIAGRFTPGSFTNQITKAFKEPRLIVVSDPTNDHQAIREASYVNIPVIAFANPESSLRCVDIAIPCNNKASNAIGLMWWFLAREVLRLRGSIPRTVDWDVMVDLFIRTDPEQSKEDMQGTDRQMIAEEQVPVAHDLGAGVGVAEDPWSTGVSWNAGDTFELGAGPMTTITQAWMG